MKMAMMIMMMLAAATAGSRSSDAMHGGIEKSFEHRSSANCGKDADISIYLSIDHGHSNNTPVY
jgi:hypothetical protein